MTDSFWSNLAGIITATGLLVTAVFTFWTHLKVGKVETTVDKVQAQTDGMNRAMVETAKKEAKAEVIDTISAVAPASGLPVAITPLGNDPKAVEWIKMGIEIEKARKERENGVQEGEKK